MENFKEWVPGYLAWAMTVFAVIVIQSVSGMYGVIFHHITLANGLDTYDSLMMMRVMLIGTSCFFPLAIKLKSVFSPKQAATLSLSIVLICLMVFPMLQSMPARFVVGMISGFFQMFGTFELLGMFRIPVVSKSNFGVFISFVFLIMLGCADFFSYAKPRLALAFGEKQLLWITAAFIAGAIILVRIFMKSSKAPVPKLSGREWKINLLELLFLMIAVLAFVLILFQRSIIPLLIVGLLSSTAVIITSRRTGIRLIDKKSFCFKEAIHIGIVFLVLDFILAAGNMLQSKYISECTDWGAYVPQLKLIDLTGLIIGYFISASTFRKGMDKITVLTCSAFASLLIYLALMLISTGAGPAYSGMLAFASSLFLGIGQMILFCVFNAYLMARLAIPLYFHSISLLGILRNCLGIPLGGSIVCGILSLQESGQSIISAINSIYTISALLVVAYLTLYLIKRNNTFLLKTNQLSV